MWRYCTEIFDYLSLSAIIDDRVSLLFICFQTIVFVLLTAIMKIVCNVDKKESLYVQEFLVRNIRDGNLLLSILLKLPHAPLFLTL